VTGALMEHTEQHITDAVLASFAEAGSERFAEVMRSLTAHLHAFAREVRLTQDEWRVAIDFLTRTGHITDERRQEFVLLSDVLGLSMLTVGINAPAADGATDATVFGPFFRDDAPEVPFGGDIANGAKGVPCYVAGTVRDTSGRPVPGARIEVWEADEDGMYDVQYGERTAARGRLRADDQGRYRFWSVRPAAYRIPCDGPVGELLAAAGRSPWRPAHIHFMVVADGYRTLITHAFAAGDEHLGDDAVFGVKPSLVTEFADHPPGPGPDGRPVGRPWTSVAFDLVLAPA
jgi:protocatechuate 3,4-dioxygenase beta subunit